MSDFKGRDEDRNTLGFVAGFPKGSKGEIILSYIDQGTLKHVMSGHKINETVDVWTIKKRNPYGVKLPGISGAPVINDNWQVMGVMVATNRARGRVFTSRPYSIKRLLREEGVKLPENVKPRPHITEENYMDSANLIRDEDTVVKAYCFR
jgi:hypothetical protein